MYCGKFGVTCFLSWSRPLRLNPHESTSSLACFGNQFQAGLTSFLRPPYPPQHWQ